MACKKLQFIIAKGHHCSVPCDLLWKYFEFSLLSNKRKQHCNSLHPWRRVWVTRPFGSRGWNHCGLSASPIGNHYLTHFWTTEMTLLWYTPWGSDGVSEYLSTEFEHRICRNKRSNRNKRPPKTVIFQRGEYTKPMGFWWVIFSKRTQRLNTSFTTESKEFRTISRGKHLLLLPVHLPGADFFFEKELKSLQLFSETSHNPQLWFPSL